MTILELLSATAWAWIVRSWQLLSDDWRVMWLLALFACVLVSSLSLSLFGFIEVSFLLVEALLVFNRCSLLHRTLVAEALVSDHA